VGYFTDRVKKATLLSDSETAVAFDLLDEGGNVVYSGVSQPFGYDMESGDNVHILDFTDFNTKGTYSLRAGEEAASRTFDIGIGEIYSGLTYDALNFFYQARSGMVIEEQYITSGDAAALARGAGHAPDMGEIYHTWGYDASSGTQDVAGIYAWRAACNYISKIGFKQIHENESKIYERIEKELKDVGKVKILSVPKTTSLLSFQHEQIHAHDIEDLFSEKKVLIRAGHICSQNSIAKYGYKPIVRISFGIGIQENDVERLVDVIRGTLG
jgi:hypothetical protein